MMIAAISLVLFIATSISAMPSQKNRPRPVSNSCANNNSSQCYPAGLYSAPLSLIQCLDDMCVCSECFTLDHVTGKCSLTVPSPANCYYYDTKTLKCIDNRKSQIRAFILSLTLSGAGAANFYIGQYNLGAGQLVLSVSILSILGVMVCTLVCAVFFFRINMKNGGVFCIFITSLILLFATLLIGAWIWCITDQIIFGMNNRKDGNNCPLRSNL